MKTISLSDIRERRKKLIIGALTVTGCVVTALAVQGHIIDKTIRSRVSTIVKKMTEEGAKSLSQKRLHPDMASSVGIFCDVWHNNGAAMAIVTDLKVSDMGRLGEEFLKIDGVTPESIIAATLETTRY